MSTKGSWFQALPFRGFHSVHSYFWTFFSFFRVSIWFHLCVRFFLLEGWQWPWVNTFPRCVYKFRAILATFSDEIFFQALLDTLSIRLDALSGFHGFEPTKSCDFKLVWNVLVWERVLQGLLFIFEGRESYQPPFERIHLFLLVKYRGASTFDNWWCFRELQRFVTCTELEGVFGKIQEGTHAV